MKITLKCGGKAVDGSLISLSLHRELGRLPLLKTRHEYREEEAGIFKPGASVSLSVEDGAASLKWEGVATRVALSMSGGEKVVRLTAGDKAHCLTLGRRTALFLKKSDAEIVKEIVGARGLSADIPATSPKHPQTQQARVSDWDFICRALYSSSLVPLVSNGQVKALKLDSLGSKDILEIDADSQELLSLDLSADDRAWFKEAAASAWDDSKQKVVKGKSGDKKPPRPGSLKPSGGAAQELFMPQNIPKAELDALSDGLLWRLRQGFLSGRARLAGLVASELGCGLSFKNCGQWADGKSALWASRLEIKGGECFTELRFGCDFQKLEGRKKGGQSELMAGEQPELFGLYPAKVTKLEDPDKGGRIEIHIPLLHEEGQKVWARAAQVYAGADRGFVFRPEKDDEVLAGFLGADPAAPVVVGALPSKANAAPKDLAAADEKNSHKGFVSKSGLTFLLDEEAKSFLLKTPGGQSLAINDKDAAITIKDKNGNAMTLDKSGISLKSNGDIKIEAGKNMNLKAAADLKGQGLSCQLQGQKDIKLAGQAMGEISSSGILTVKGSLVKIN